MHNANKPDASNAAAVAAYNNEANQQNAEMSQARSAFLSCEAVEKRLIPPGSPKFKLPSQEILGGVDSAIKGVPKDWQPSNPLPSRGGRVTVPSEVRNLYTEVRKLSPPKPKDVGDVPLQNMPRPKVGAADPAYPGRVITKNNGDSGPAVSPDHIVSLAEIIQLKGFTQLSARNMIAVLNAPVNLQWLSRRANESKNSRGVLLLGKFNSAFVEAQNKLQGESREKLLQLIQDLIRLQGGQP